MKNQLNLLLALSFITLISSCKKTTVDIDDHFLSGKWKVTIDKSDTQDGMTTEIKSRSEIDFFEKGKALEKGYMKGRFSGAGEIIEINFDMEFEMTYIVNNKTTITFHTKSYKFTPSDEKTREQIESLGGEFMKELEKTIQEPATTTVLKASQNYMELEEKEENLIMVYKRQ